MLLFNSFFFISAFCNLYFMTGIVLSFDIISSIIKNDLRKVVLSSFTQIIAKMERNEPIKIANKVVDGLQTPKLPQY